MFKYINFLLLAILLLIFSCEEIMPVIEGCIIESACNYNADATDDDDTCVYNQGCNQWCNGDEGEPQEFDCSSECGGDRVEDNCGTCDNDSSNDCVQDCANDWGGSAVVDVCDVCGGDGSSCTDCNGDINGTAVEDECGVCDATYETQPVFPYGDCDCNGDLDGEASIDGCGDCVGGDTGLTPCANDCLGVIGGDAVYDNCGEECVVVNPVAVCTEHCDNNPDNNCVQDCYGKWGGEALEDSCGVCSGGNSGHEADSDQDCNGDCFGLDGVANTGDEAVVDECGICDATYATKPAFPYGTCDCNGIPAGGAFKNGCGDCAVEGNHPECTEDCTGELGGTSFYDDCDFCVPAGDTSCVQGCDGIWKNDGTQIVNDACDICGGDNSICADCAGTPNGEAIIDDCGVCSGGNTEHVANSDQDICGECGGDGIDCIGCNGWYMENFICDEDGAAEKCCLENSDKIDDKCILRDNNTNAGCSLSTNCQVEYEIDCDEIDEFCDYDGAYIGEPCSTISGSFIEGEGKCKKKCTGGLAICTDKICSEAGYYCKIGTVVGGPCSTTESSLIAGEGECKLYTTNDTYRTTGYITYHNTRCSDGTDDCCEEPPCDKPAKLSLVYINETTIQVNYISSMPIYGVDFHIPGTIISSGSGGLAADNSWSVGTASAGGDRVLGGDFFNLTPIPAGEDILTNLTVTIDASTEKLCLTGLIIANDPDVGGGVGTCPKYWPLTCIPTP